MSSLPHNPYFKSRASFDANPPTNQIFQADIQHPDNERLFALRHGVLDPQGFIYISWLCVLSVTFWYNAWVIPLRSSFPFQTPANSSVWLMTDGCADLIYLLDILFVKHRIMYLHEGFWVRDPKLTRQNYMKKTKFKVSQTKNLFRTKLLFIKICSKLCLALVGFDCTDPIRAVIFQVGHTGCLSTHPTFGENTKLLGIISLVRSSYSVTVPCKISIPILLAHPWNFVFLSSKTLSRYL